ncbi:TRAP transporter small permease subunit [Fodinicurvata sp. EGI_FJ10296]|uniref:TRAP transporter small permease n=1 Tax=Fodinicurvata sp. EGI_FJ10296 TaxID=3231908 RepID=UPI003454B37A
MSFQRRARDVLKMLGRLELALGIIILVAIVAIILTQVTSRYVFGRPLTWPEELATYLLIWLGFVTASVAYKLHRHIAIKAYSGLVGERSHRLGSALVHLIIAATLTALVIHLPSAMRTEMLRETVSLPVTLPKHLFFSVPTLVAFISMILSALFFAIEALAGRFDPILPTFPDPTLSEDIMAPDQSGRVS